MIKLKNNLEVIYYIYPSHLTDEQTSQERLNDLSNVDN